MKKFAYIFNVGSRIAWSGDTEEMLKNRIKKESKKVKTEVNNFIKNSQPGDFYVIEPYGEMILVTRSNQ